DYVFDGTSPEPYDEDDEPNPLSVYGTRGKNFLLTMRRLAAEGKPLRVVDDQRGAPTWSRMIAQAATFAAISLDPDEPGGLYHLPADGGTTWYGFARAILGESADITPISTSEYPTPAPRPLYSVLDGSKFEERFGFTLPDWETQLRMAMEEN
ncbi:dTDP-4-dehydrorhamnose reductase, partial [bacterium]